MTGLDPATDTIMSISCFLTTSDLLPLDSSGYDAVISHTASQLSNMSEWCIQTHGLSGLTQQCLSSTKTAQTAALELAAYVKRFIPEPRRALLAGNSIHADKMFLMVPPWQVVLEHLHYRLFDVSSMKEMVRRWARPDLLVLAPRKENRHTAREDILESIEEARYYKSLIERMEIPAPNPPAAYPGGITRADLGPETTIPIVPPSLHPSAVVPLPAHEDPPIDGTSPGVPLQNPVSNNYPDDPFRLTSGYDPAVLTTGLAHRAVANNGTSDGSIGDTGSGFRTDVP